MHLGGSTDTILHKAPHTPTKLCSKEKISRGFSDMTSPVGKLLQTAWMMGEKSSPNFKGKELASLFCTEIPVQKPVRLYWSPHLPRDLNRLSHGRSGDGRASCTSPQASTSGCFAQRILPASSVLKVFSLHSTGKNPKGEFGSKHTENYKMLQPSCFGAWWCSPGRMRAQGWQITYRWH